MRYVVTIGETVLELTVEERDDGSHDVLVGDRRVRAHLRPMGGRSLFSLLVDHQSFDVAVVSGEDGARVTIHGRELSLRVESEQQRGARLLTGGVTAQRKHRVKSPMPGIVTKVFVTEGQVVEVGTPLALLEAMKMQNEIRSPGAGTLTRVHAVAGKTVNGGDPLFELE